MRHIMWIVAAMAGLSVMPVALTSGHEARTEVVAFMEKNEVRKAAADSCVTTLAADALSAGKSAEAEKASADSKELFERTVEIIKEYEGLHGPDTWPYVGYGHRVRKGERYAKGVRMSEKEADRLLRADLKEYLGIYEDYGRDAYLLAALAYNCGTGRVSSSKVLAKLRAGDRDIRSAYLSHSRSAGKTLPRLRERREQELQALYIP